MKNNELLSRIDACHMTRIARCKVLESSHPLRQQHRRTCLPTFNSSPSIVVVISAHLPSSQSLSLPTEHSLFHAHVPLSAREASMSQDARVEQFAGYAIRQITSYGQFRQHLKSHLFRA